MMRETDLAYLAGLIDGEGYIGIKKSKAYACQDRITPGYHARIQVRMVEESAIEFLARTLGGTYYKEKPHSHQGRPLFCFQASDRKAEGIIQAIRPWLRVKAEQADVLLRFRALQATSRQHRTKVIGYRTMNHWTGKKYKAENKVLSDEYVAECEAMYERCKHLNRVGVAAMS